MILILLISRALGSTLLSQSLYRPQGPRILYNNKTAYKLTSLLGWNPVLILLYYYIYPRKEESKGGCFDKKRTRYHSLGLGQNRGLYKILAYPGPDRPLNPGGIARTPWTLYPGVI